MMNNIGSSRCKHVFCEIMGLRFGIFCLYFINKVIVDILFILIDASIHNVVGIFDLKRKKWQKKITKNYLSQKITTTRFLCLQFTFLNKF